MALFSRGGDRGNGSFNDYGYDLVAKNKRITIVLAGSSAYQDELAAVLESGDSAIETAMPARTIEQERVDAEIEVRLFSGRRVSGVVGVVPRGLESVVDENVRRLDGRGDKPRIPVRITGKPGSYRVELQMGAIR